MKALTIPLQLSVRCPLSCLCVCVCVQSESRGLKQERDEAVLELRHMQGRDLEGLKLEKLEQTEAAIKEALQRVSKEKERVIKDRLEGQSVRQAGSRSIS